MIQTFIIVGNPRPQGRHRNAVIGGHARAYERREDKENKGNLRAQMVIQGAKRLIPAGTPVAIRVLFHLPRPKGHYGRNGNILPRFQYACPTARPDCDNLVKALKDAASGVIWHDDCMVVHEAVTKIYSDMGRITFDVYDDVFFGYDEQGRYREIWIRDEPTVQAAGGAS